MFGFKFIKCMILVFQLDKYLLQKKITKVLFYFEPGQIKYWYC